MMEKKNAVVKMRRLGKRLQKDVRARKTGIFRNTIIADGNMAYGYDRDGNVYQIDVENLPLVARYMWRRDDRGYCVTEELCHLDGRPVRVEELTMGRSEGLEGGWI